MIRRSLAPLLMLLAMVLPLAIPATAWAVPKVALVPIDGDSESEVRDALAEALDGNDYKLVGKKEVSRAVDKLGDPSGLNEKSAKKLARELAADAIIVGSLDKEGAVRVLKLKLYVNGRAKKGFSVRFKNAGSPKFKDALRKKLAAKLDGATASDEEAPKKPKKPGPGDDEGEPMTKAPKGEKAAKPRKGEKGEGDDEAAPRVAPTGGDDDEDDAPKPRAVPAGAGDDEAAPRKGGKKTAAALDGDEDEVGIRKSAGPVERGRPANHAAIRLVVGPSAVARRLVFNTNLPAAKAPKPFQPATVPGTRVEGELYPAAFGSPYGVVAGLGVAFSFDRTLKLNLGTSAEPTVKIPAEQFRYAVGPRFRIVGRSASSPSVTLGADLGRSRFRADRSGLMDPASLDLPDTYYKYLAPALGIRIPLGIVAFHADGSGLIVSDAGQIVRPSSYGQAKVFGVAAQAGFDVVIVRRFLLRFTGEFSQIGFQFMGNGGAQANSRDGDPTTRDVGGAADRLFGGAVTLGLSY